MKSIEVKTTIRITEVMSEKTKFIADCNLRESESYASSQLLTAHSRKCSNLLHAYYDNISNIFTK